MNRLFGTSKQQPAAKQEEKKEEETQEKKPVMDLSDQAKRTEAKVQELTSQINELDKEIAANYDKSKKSKGVMANTAKQRCIMLLKKKKLYEQQLSQLLNNQFTLDQMAFTKENIQNTIGMAQGMQEQIAVQREMFKDIDMDKMDDLMDDMEEMKQESDYMNDMMNRDYGVEIDEDELDREMQEIDDEMFQQEMNQPNSQASQQKSVVQQQQVQQNQL